MLETNTEPRKRETFFYPAQPAAPARPAHRVTALSSACHEQMHPAVYKIAFTCWMGLLSVFVITFFSSTNALFMIVSSGLSAALLSQGVTIATLFAITAVLNAVVTFAIFLSAPDYLRRAARLTMFTGRKTAARP